MINSRRNFIKKTSLASASFFAAPAILGSCSSDYKIESGELNTPLIVPKKQGLKITGTFLDEISHDIPHQNWGMKEWDKDFQYIKVHIKSV